MEISGSSTEGRLQNVKRVRFPISSKKGKYFVLFAPFVVDEFDNHKQIFHGLVKEADVEYNVSVRGVAQLG
jgi:hypothetical protein